MRMICRTVAPAVAAALSASPTSAASSQFNIYVQTPFAVAGEAGSLDDAERAGSSAPLFSRRVRLPIEDAVAALDAMLPKGGQTIAGVAACDDPCPDVAWRITPNVRVTLLNAPDPEIRNIGPSDAARVEVQATATVRIDASAAITAGFIDDVVSFVSGGDVNANPSAYMILTGRGRAATDLWPAIGQPSVDVSVELVDANIEIALNDTVVPRAANWGAIGFGALSVPGGPLLGALVGGLLGDAAADAAEDEIRRRYRQEIDRALRQANDMLTQEVRTAVANAVDGLPDLETLVNGATAPGLGVSVGAANTLFGGRFEVHSVGRGGSLDIAITHRFDPPPANARLAVELRLPKQACRYTFVGDGAAKGLVIHAEPVPINEDLASRVGQPCGQALGLDPVAGRAFLGADPQSALGPGALARAVWAEGAGTAMAGGLLVDGGEVYACAIDVGALPEAAVVELDAAAVLGVRLGTVDGLRRAMSAPLPGGGTLWLDETFAPLPTRPDGSSVIAVGGPMAGCSGFSSAGGAQAGTLADRLDAALDPENCVACGSVDVTPNMRMVTTEDLTRLGGGALIAQDATLSRRFRMDR